MGATVYYERLVGEDIDTGTGVVTKRNPGGGSLTGTQVGLHTFAVGTAQAQAVWDPPSVANGSMTTTTVTVNGANLGDYAIVSFSLSLQSMEMTASVSATNTVTVVLSNLTGASVDLASGTLSVLVFKSR
jgi:hypothetical protein